MTSINIRRTVAAIVAASCMAIPASASAQTLPPTFRSDAAQSGGEYTTTAGAATSTLPSARTLPPTFRSDAAQSGGTQPEPTTVEVVQPERTIVRDVDEVLPIVLSGTALLAVLALFGFTLVRTRLVPRPDRSH
jgi:hypothetical protein